MNSGTNSEANDFLSVAVKHKMLDDEQLETIRLHASEHNIENSDAVLSLSMLEPHEVDAIQLLASPSSLHPGYELIDLIGCGTGGLVFLAYQKALDRNIALKTINAQGRSATATGESRIQREAQAIAKLQHPNIVSAFDSGFFKGRFCIAMEYVPGDCLSDYIEKSGALSEREALEIIRQAASALAHAAEHGIIHRDIKPSNLLLCKPPAGFVLPEDVPFVKVADFGLALEFNQDDGSQLTATGTALGTPAYVAPEQLQDSHVDQRADIYSLGATLYHMLVGKAPFSDYSSIKAIMLKSLGEDGWREDAKEKASEETYGLFRSMTEIDLDDRLSDYSDLVLRVEKILNSIEDPTAASATQISAQATKGDRRDANGKPKTGSGKQSRLMLAAAGSIIVALAASAAFFLPNVFSSSNPTEPSPVTRNGEWVVDDVPIPLFTGQSVPHQFQQSGLWTDTEAPDNSRVLRGEAPAYMRFPLSEDHLSRSHVRLRLRTSLEANGVVEFDIEEGKSHNKLAMTRLDAAKGTAEFFPSESAIDPVANGPVELKPEQRDIDEHVVWQTIAVIKHDTQISVFVNGEKLGSLNCIEGADTFLLTQCKNSASIFADIDIVGLKFQEQ